MRVHARAGFTLVELVLVLLVAVILSGLAIPSLSGLSRAKANLTATQVRSIFVYAQDWAAGTGRPTWVGYTSDTQTISAFQASADNLAFASRLALQDPLSRSSMSVDLSDLFRKKDLIQAEYGVTRLTLKFDSTGTPVDSTDKPLENDVLIPLANGVGVRIRAGTGLVSIL